jgi:BirA family biotin operon repressor/biotin-[acetyl-CoA-carboxylase] ligase
LTASSLRDILKKKGRAAMLSKEKITEELIKLGVKPPKIIYYELTDSTNTRAKEYARANPDQKDPVVFIADGQTGGRGRLGRSFVSNSGAGIYISILSYPDGEDYNVARTTAGAAVALAKATEELCDCNIGIKWVNDLYLGSKKLAGILTEGEVNSDGKMAFQVVGMGINVYKNAISDEISDIATSLEGEKIIPPNRSVLAAHIIKNHLAEDSGFYEEYRARSVVVGREVTVVKLNKSYPACVLDINRDFSLKIKTDRGIEDLFTGEVSLKI